ncbi:MAG: tautomerase family protein [Actinobacteria bacterium]|nr:tautomerase family protein [Actinomycetota bacterium]
MPIVTIDLLEGRTVQQKRELAEKITAIISEVAEVKPEVVWIKINEMKKENFSTGGTLKIDV